MADDLKSRLAQLAKQKRINLEGKKPSTLLDDAADSARRLGKHVLSYDDVVHPPGTSLTKDNAEKLRRLRVAAGYSRFLPVD